MDDEWKQLLSECVHDDCDIFSSKIPALFDRNRCNIEPHQLIWLDSSHEDGFMLHQLRAVVDYVKTFDNSIECQEYIERTSDTATFFITSGLLGQQILPYIHNHDHITSVYIFCQNKRFHEQWSSHFSKVKCICTEFIELSNNLAQDVDDYLRRHHHNQRVGFQIVDGIDTTIDAESFKWLSCLVDLLRAVSYPTNVEQQLTDALRTYYDANARKLAIIEEFEQTYSRDTAIRWYTRPTFIYDLLNRALRQRNIPVIFLFGFFLRDLHDQLEEEYEKYRDSRLEKSLLTVYRGQFIAKYEIEKLNSYSSDSPLVCNSFLSTTPDRAIAMLFVNSSHHDDELSCIVFEIEVSFEKPCRPFADVTRLSYIPDEQEILFSIGTLFELKEIRYDEGDRVWIAKMTLHDRIRLGDNASVKIGERQRLKEKLTDFPDIIFSATLEQTQLIFENVVRLFPSDKWISAIKYRCLGERDWFDDNNNEAVKHYLQAIHIWLDYSSDDELNALVDIAELYERIAHCYQSTKEWTLANENFDVAIHYYDSATARVEMVPLHKAFCYNRCARIYEEKSTINHRSTNLATAIKYDKERLAVLLEHSPLSNDVIGGCYRCLGKNHRENSDYCQAFKCYESALNTFLQTGEPPASEIHDLSKKLVEICSKEMEPDIDVMLKYQILAHEHLLITLSTSPQERKRNYLAASYEKLADLYEASNQPHIAFEHRLSAAKLREGSQAPP